MALPKGFDPTRMSFDNVVNPTPIIDIPRRSAPQPSYSSSYTCRRRSLWGRYSDFVASIGNWIADHSEQLLGWVNIAILGLIIIGGIISVISVWIDEGFIWALVAGVVAYFVVVILLAVVSFVITLVGNIAMLVLRYIFWNGITLLITIAAIAGRFIWQAVA